MNDNFDGCKVMNNNLDSYEVMSITFLFYSVNNNLDVCWSNEW